MEPLRIGFVGCGGISRMYTDIYAQCVDLAQVVAVADLDATLAAKRRDALTARYTAAAHQARVQALDARNDEAAQRHWQLATAAERASQTPIRTYRSYADLLRAAEVEVLVLLTPPGVRVEPTVAAAESGCHVFTQGPMARSVAEADAMQAAVEKAGIHFHSQCGARYARDMLLAQRAVASGLLGQMGSARVELNWYRAQAYYRGWHGTWEGEGGGAAFHHGRYIIDPFLWVVGSSVVELFAYAGPMLRQIEHENLSQAVVRFANGATGMIHASLLNHRQAATPEGRIEILGHDAGLLTSEEYYPVRSADSGNSYWEAVTTFGSSDNPAAVAALEALRQDLSLFPAQASEAYQTRLFLENVRTGTAPLVPSSIPRHHVEVVRALYKSAAEHQPVTLPLDKDDPFYRFDGRLSMPDSPAINRGMSKN